MSNLADRSSAARAAHNRCPSNGSRRVTVEIADAARLSDMHSIGPICWAAPQLPTCSWIQLWSALRQASTRMHDTGRCSPGKRGRPQPAGRHLELCGRPPTPFDPAMQTIVIPA